MERILGKTRLVREQHTLDEVRFVAFSRGDFLVYARLFESI